jgi:hypothetical protein
VVAVDDDVEVVEPGDVDLLGLLGFVGVVVADAGTTPASWPME